MCSNGRAWADETAKSVVLPARSSRQPSPLRGVVPARALRRDRAPWLVGDGRLDLPPAAESRDSAERDQERADHRGGTDAGRAPIEARRGCASGRDVPLIGCSSAGHTRWPSPSRWRGADPSTQPAGHTRWRLLTRVLRAFDARLACVPRVGLLVRISPRRGRRAPGSAVAAGVVTAAATSAAASMRLRVIVGAPDVQWAGVRRWCQATIPSPTCSAVSTSCRQLTQCLLGACQHARRRPSSGRQARGPLTPLPPRVPAELLAGTSRCPRQTTSCRAGRDCSSSAGAAVSGGLDCSSRKGALGRRQGGVLVAGETSARSCERGMATECRVASMRALRASDAAARPVRRSESAQAGGSAVGPRPARACRGVERICSLGANAVVRRGFMPLQRAERGRALSTR